MKHTSKKAVYCGFQIKSYYTYPNELYKVFVNVKDFFRRTSESSSAFIFETIKKKTKIFIIIGKQKKSDKAPPADEYSNAALISEVYNKKRRFTR